MMRSIQADFGPLVTLITGLVLAIGCGGPSTGPTPNLAKVETIRTSLGSSDAAAASGDEEDAAEPTGFATLRGTFKVEGNVPAPTTLSITKDEAVCAPGGKTVLANDVIVDPATKGLANVLIYAEKVPESWCHADAAPGANTDEILFDQKECIFLTRMVAMRTSQSLKALNSDPVGHNLMVESFNQTIPSGGMAIYQPQKEIRSPSEMRCAVHPWMKAWFINRDNGYFAVTKPDGSFEIPNLPAGVPLVFRVWQEKSGPISQATVNGNATKWSKGKMSLELAPDSEIAMDVVLDAAIFQ